GDGGDVLRLRLFQKTQVIQSCSGSLNCLGLSSIILLDCNRRCGTNYRCILMGQDSVLVNSKIREYRVAADLGEVPLVSVIVPSRNSGRTIAECLKSVFSQSYKPIEIIVVDGFSIDSTREIAQKMGAFVASHAGGRSAQKNCGAKVAKGEYLYFVDADYRVGPDVVSGCVSAISEADGVLIRNQDITRGSRVSNLFASRRRVLSYDPLNVA